MNVRSAIITRKTNETDIKVDLCIDGSHQLDIATGLGFFDHMLSALAFHAGWDLALIAKGDIEIDDHHTIEDCGIALGQAIAAAISNKQAMARFGSKYAPLDEALARTVIDFSGRPTADINLDLKRESIGAVACENLTHFFHSLANAGTFTLHVDVLKGENDHHKAEAAFKSTALAMKDAMQRNSGEQIIPSTKGAL